jgi:hypothetical protein
MASALFPGSGGAGSDAGSVAFASAAARTAARADPQEGLLGSSNRATSHSQQSLQRPHFSHRWLLHASLVQSAQIRIDSSPQMLQTKGMITIVS